MINLVKGNFIRFFLLFIFLILSVGGSLLILIKKQQIKNEVHELIKIIPNSELVVFSMPYSPNQDFLEEFHFKGSMYDVVKYDVKDGFVYYYCFNDKDESAITKLSARFHGFKDLQNSRHNFQHLLKALDIKYLQRSNFSSICPSVKFYLFRVIECFNIDSCLVSFFVPPKY